ncbi:MAG TPA: ABC transporter ATP-binding protein [Alphaproteobacteria bacterium]|nr:ABC transporter ATP-binding protein [Alphaproteobacteria bacterium]
MTADCFLELDDVHVDLPVLDAHQRSFKQSLLRLGGGRLADRGGGMVVRALQGVSLRLQAGDRVALVGFNGSGKTTLLRVMAGILEPMQGRVRSRGRVVALFDALLGIDPDLNAYDNIALRGALLGLSDAEIARELPEIERFTELGAYLRLPVRTYSKGMLMRLGFAISTAVRPDILLIDEVLAAGDIQFNRRAEARLAETLGSSGIAVICSHGPNLLRQFCTSGVYMEEGRVALSGALEPVLGRYTDLRAAGAPARMAPPLAAVR